jgi:DNA replication and repair protein RecF
MSNSTVLALIFSKKKRIYRSVYPYFQHHQAITGSQETVQLVYESHLLRKRLIDFITGKH